ncbi:MAG: hypothetical protein ABR981_03570 [Candidatus Micrarchaeaceae archaeon]|jgi:hypothetical protein
MKSKAAAIIAFSIALSISSLSSDIQLRKEAPNNQYKPQSLVANGFTKTKSASKVRKQSHQCDQKGGYPVVLRSNKNYLRLCSIQK